MKDLNRSGLGERLHEVIHPLSVGSINDHEERVRVVDHRFRVDRQAVALSVLRGQVFEQHLCHRGVAGWAAISLVAVLDDEQAHRPFLLCSVFGHLRGLAYRLHHPEVRRVDRRLILRNLGEQPIQKLD